MAVEMLTVRAELVDELSAKAKLIRGEVAGLERDMAKLSTTSAVGAAPALGAVEKSGKSLGEMAVGLRGRVTSLSESLWGMVEHGTKVAVEGLTVLAGVAGGFAIKAVTDFEQAQVGLSSVLGSATAGADMFGKIRDSWVKTPFEATEISRAAQGFITMGMASDKVLPLLDAVGNISALQGDPKASFDTIVTGLQKIQETGKLDPRMLRSMVLAGMPAYDLLAQKMGVTVRQVKDLLDTGAVSAGTFLDSITNLEGPLQMFAGGTGKWAGTLGGMFTTLKHTITEKLADTASPLSGAIKGALPQLTTAVGGLIDQVGPPVVTLLGSMAQLLTGVLPIVGPVLMALATGFSQVLTALGPSLVQLAPQIPKIADAFAKLMIALLPLAPVLGNLLVSMGPLAISVLTLATNLTLMLLPVITPIINGLANLINNSSGFRDVLAAVLIGILAFRAVDSVVSSVAGFARAIGLMAAQTQGLAIAEGNEAAARGAGVAGSAGIGTMGGVLGTAAGVGLAAHGMLGNKGRPTLGGDLQTVGGFGLAGAGLGSIIPGAGTLVGGALGLGVGGVAVGLHHLFAQHPTASATPSSAGNVTVHAPVTVAAGVDPSMFQDPAFQTYLAAAVTQYQADRTQRGH